MEVVFHSGIYLWSSILCPLTQLFLGVSQALAAPSDSKTSCICISG